MTLPAVEPSRVKEVQSRLRQLEVEHSMRVLYACESGSRAWGFHSANSDYDVRFIFVRPVDHYLRLSPPRDVIELGLEGDLDLSGWDVFKACHLLRRTNPPLLEWLGSPVVYEDDGLTAAALRAASARHFNRRACGEHYLSMAKRSWDAFIDGREAVVRKKYLYAVRPLACLEWLMRRSEMPPTRFDETLAGIDLPAAVRLSIDDLVRTKLAAEELGQGPRLPSLDQYIERWVTEGRTRLDPVESVPFPTAELDELVRVLLLTDR